MFSSCCGSSNKKSNKKALGDENNETNDENQANIDKNNVENRTDDCVEILLKDREVETIGKDVISQQPTEECEGITVEPKVLIEIQLVTENESVEVQEEHCESEQADFEPPELPNQQLVQTDVKESNSEDSDSNGFKPRVLDHLKKSPEREYIASDHTILPPPVSYQVLAQSPDNSDSSSNNPTIESSQNNSLSVNSQIVPNAVIEQLTQDQPEEIFEADYLSSPPSTPSDNTISTEHPKSCLSRRSSENKAYIKNTKKVNYSDSKEYIPYDDGSFPTVADDDEVFSDSISPQLPRGDMCTPYPKKKGSIPGLSFPSDWFPDDTSEVDGVHREPPVTPIGRDELALKRHRFFADLLSAAQAAVDHKVCFNPLGPDVAITDNFDCDPNQKPSTTAELGHLIDRLEKIVERLERAVSARELASVNATLNAVIQKTDSEELDSLPLPLPPSTPNFDLLIGNTTVDIVNESIALLNGKKDSIDLENLPTVIYQICADEYLTQDEPDYSPPSSMSILGYQDIVSGPLIEYINLSKQIGGDVAKHAEAVESAFNAQLAYVTIASTSAQPSAASQQQLLKPTSDQITVIQEFREKNRTSPFFNHLSAVSESIPALGWVCVSPTPGPHVKEMNDAGQFYTNRVLKEWKEKDSKHVEWARAWIQTLTELQKYIRQYHTTGLVWSGKTVASASCPPPPPPGMPPPPPVLPDLGSLALGSGDERSALFAQINQGADITKGLKKVTSDMQTHKNTALRSGPAPFKAPVSLPSPGNTAPAPLANKSPVFTRDGKKWLIEYQKNNPNLIVENTEMNNMVYLFKCEGSTLTVKGKINGIIFDSCKKCSVLLDSVVSAVEFVNCQSVQMQVLGNVPTISIDKTDGCQMYLSDKSLDVEIISSKSSEMNVLIPKGNGDYTEKPIPEQFKTKIQGNSLTTTCVESLG